MRVRVIKVSSNGYLFAAADDGQHVFCHARSFESGVFDTVERGDELEVEIDNAHVDDRGPRARSARLAPAGTLSDADGAPLRFGSGRFASARSK